MSNTEVAPAPVSAPTATPQFPVWPLAVLGGLLVWAYLPMLAVFADKWLNDPQYSHGLLVPFFSIYLIRRTWRDDPLTLKPMPILGCGLLVVVLGLRVVSGSLLFHQLDALSLVIALVAVSLAMGGTVLLKRTGPGIAFLIFMIPLPYELERNVGQPMKAAATTCSTFMLQTLGQPAIRDGNLILIDEVRLGVVDACSGLKMLMTFAAFSVGAVLLMKRSRFEKFMVVLGIIPIAIAANVMRITATGMCYVWFTDPKLLEFLHDLNGWLMMPVGLALLGLEIWILRRLVLEPEQVRRPAVGLGSGARGLSPVPA